MNGSTNLLIAGLGGQGVVGLSRALVALADARGVPVRSTVHKGGAQTLGTVSAELRFGRATAATIPPGCVDVLVALDPWEALRAIRSFGIPDAGVVECVDVAPQLDRTAATDPALPVAQLTQLGLHAQLRPLRDRSVERFGDARMRNFVAGLAALPHLPDAMRDASAFTDSFLREVPRAHRFLQPAPRVTP